MAKHHRMPHGPLTYGNVRAFLRCRTLFSLVLGPPLIFTHARREVEMGRPTGLVGLRPSVLRLHCCAAHLRATRSVERRFAGSNPRCESNASTFSKPSFT